MTAEIGIVGFLLFVFILLTVVGELWKVRRAAARDPAQQDVASLAQGALIAMAAFLVGSMFGVKDTDPLLWVLLGISGSIVIVHRRMTSEGGTANHAQADPLPSAASLTSRPSSF